ncbi:hypothetical protein DFAR_1860042 [Desulfarculales bacterium]
MQMPEASCLGHQAHIIGLGNPFKRNAPSYLHLEEITASLGIALVHSPPYVPQGKGKI